MKTPPSPSNCNKCVYIELFDRWVFRYFVLKCHGGHKIKKHSKIFCLSPSASIIRLPKGDSNVPRPQSCIDAKDKRYSTKPSFKEIVKRIDSKLEY